MLFSAIIWCAAVIRTVGFPLYFVVMAEGAGVTVRQSICEFTGAEASRSASGIHTSCYAQKYIAGFV